MAHMKENSKAYDAEAANLALSRVTIFPCIKCGHPLIEGYCCGHCGSGDGFNPDMEPSVIEI